MPLKLHPPRKGFSPNWRIRGKYLGCRVDQSSGTHRRHVAATKLAEIEDAIERKEWPPAPAEAGEDLSFAAAAVSYMETTGNSRYVAPLIKHFGMKPWREINQAALDAAAIALRPNAGPATRNACVYTPTAAIIHRKDPAIRFRRPAGAKGRKRTDYLNPPDAQAILTAAESFDAEFALLLRFLLYSGCRLGEALALEWANIHEGIAYVATSKNDDPRTVRLRDDLAALLEARRKPAGAVFRFRYGGRLKERLRHATCLACGLAAPKRNVPSPPHRLRWVNLHTFCHTWATWMRRYGGADIAGLVSTGRWRDERSAQRYTHVVAHEEWERVEQLPAMKNA
jgi:integrase